VARIRTIKPDFWSSPGVGRCSLRARLLYIAMWNWADDYGIGTSNPKELMSFAFPNDDDVTAKDFPALRKEVQNNFDVVFYTVRERPYYCIPSWDEHQRTERKAKRYNPLPEQADSCSDKGEQDSVGSSDKTQGTSDDLLGESALGSRKLEVGSSRSATTDADAQFENFWQVYPKKVNKKRAIEKWVKAVKVEEAEVIISAAVRYARFLSIPGQWQKPKDPDGWLAGEKWNDLLDESQVQQRPQLRAVVNDGRPEGW
jgi:hypothetical protein